MLSVPQAIIAMIRQTSIPPKSAAPAVAVVRPIAPIMPKATNDPIMNRSPWAKLMSSMMP